MGQNWSAARSDDSAEDCMNRESSEIKTGGTVSRNSFPIRILVSFSKACHEHHVSGQSNGTEDLRSILQSSGPVLLIAFLHSGIRYHVMSGVD